MKLIRILMLPVLVLALAGCQSMVREQRVLERSRQGAPAWTQTDSLLNADATGYSYVYVKDRVLDLPLGLEQAEAGVRQNLKYQLQNYMLKTAKLGELKPEVRTELLRSLESTITQSLAQVELKDFYFEKLSAPTQTDEQFPEYYRIYVLSQLAPDEAEALNARVKAMLSKHPNFELRAQAGTLTTL